MPNLSELTVGHRLPPRRYRVGQPTIDRYATASGDHNPLHTDPDFAATTPYGRTIAHGMMTLCFLSDTMEVLAGEAWARAGALDVAFLAPVYPGETVAVGIEIAGNDGTSLVLKVDCAADGRTVLAGEASVPLAATTAIAR